MKRFLQDVVVTGLSGKALKTIEVHKKKKQIKVRRNWSGANAEHPHHHLSKRKKEKTCWTFKPISVSFLQKKVPLDNMVLASASCLHPKNRKSKNTVKQAEFLAKQFPHVIDETRISQAKDQWKICQAEDNNKIDANLSQVDHYWRNILKFTTSSGEPKYHVLCKLVKSVLSFCCRTITVRQQEHMH